MMKNRLELRLLVVRISVLSKYWCRLAAERTDGDTSGLQSYIDENTEVQEYQEVQIAARTYLVLISGY